MAITASQKSSTSNLSLPESQAEGSQRRRPNRVPPPPAPLNVPEPVDVPRRRPPSPLRNSYTADDDRSEDGSENNDDEASIDRRSWSQRSHSPSPSLTKLASNLANRVGNLMNTPDARSARGLPTEAEIEAEAQREREKSRREAEMIIRREEEARKMVEDGVFAMIEKTTPQAYSLPPPPPRSQTMTSATSSASSSPKEKEGWFSAVKNKLTPTKEPLTPAQQIIQDTKAKEKEKKKAGKEREKEKDKEWPATPNKKYTDPAFANLVSSAASPEHATPPRPIAQDNFNMTPSPKRSIDSRDGPPLYAQFNSQGMLEVPETLVVIARRFEKLERWTVSHVRALEERMSDVERWLVEKEKEKEKEEAQSTEKSSFHSDDDEKDNGMHEIRDEIMELQGRVGELGREMAKLMTAPLNLSAGPSRHTAVPQPSPPVPPTPSSITPRSLPTLPISTPRQPTTVLRPKEVSPPSASIISNGSGRTRLPYPTGDYTSPPGSVPTKQEVLSPTNSPPSSLTENSRKRPVSIAGLPSANSNFFQSSQSASGPPTPGMPRQESTIRAVSPISPSSKISSSSSRWQTNVSPTPRKRYTVALGQPITGLAATESSEYDNRQRFTASPVSSYETPAEDGDSEMTSEDGDAEARAIGHSRDDTVGKSEARMANPPSFPNDTIRRSGSITSPPRTSPGMARIRAQSSYGPPSGFNLDLSASSSPVDSPTPIAPLRPRLRSRSIDPIGLGIKEQNGRFIDPLVIRKHEKDTLVPKTPVTPKYERGRAKVPIGELVAFFNKDTR